MMQIGGELHENYATIKPYSRSQVSDFYWQDDEIYYKSVSNREVVPLNLNLPPVDSRQTARFYSCKLPPIPQFQRNSVQFALLITDIGRLVGKLPST
jgi:hypothetical protein